MSDTSTEIHPLFNPVILGKIFSFLKIQSLKNARLTCKSWSVHCMAYLQKASKVVLVRGGKADGDYHSFRNFLDTIISSFSPENPAPFENYYLDHWAINEKREKTLKQFWDICGPSMKQLHLSNVIFYEVETIRNLLYFWSPHLESLTLEDCLFYKITNENEFSSVEDDLKTEDFDEPNISYDYYDHVTVEQLKDIERCKDISCINTKLAELSYDQFEGEEFPLAWEEVFHAFPNIQRLNVACTTQPNQIGKILDAIHTVREDSSMLGSITHLKFYQNTKTDCTLNVIDSHLYKISDIICLPLSSLAFVINESIQLESIANLVRQYSPVLKNLCIHSEKEDNTTLELFKFQRFPVLSKLCVAKNLLGENFDFIQTMPKLKQLFVWTTEEEFNWETGMDEVVLKSGALKTYSNPELHEINIGYTLTDEKAANLLCSWFKNLRVLMMALNDETIRVVFRELINLQEITIFDRHLSDAGITGNPRTLCDSSTWKGGSQREFPYIGDLKKLWKFTLTFRRYENITDSSVYQGFMDVPALSSLLLTRTKIGDKALRDLYLKPNLITMVTPTVCKGVELEYVE